jgi:hypothetical protein
MHRMLAACAAVLFSALSGAAQAAGESGGPPIAVVFDTPPGELPEGEIRERIAEELGRPVRSSADPSLATLSVARGANGDYIVRYRLPTSELERKVAPPKDANEIPVLVAFVAKNLVSDESREVMAELNPKRSTSPRIEPAASDAGSHLYLRFSLGGGYSAASYLANAASSGTARASSYKVGLSGGEIGVHAAVGSMSRSGLAYGVETSGQFSPLKQQGSLGRSGIEAAMTLQLGGFIDYYPQARGPLHMQSGISAAYTGFGSYSLEVYQPGVTSVVVRPVYGGMAYLGGGYDFGAQGGFGLFARTYVGFLANGSSNYVPLGFRVGVSVAWR